MTPTRADLERLIETWREKSRQYSLGYVTDGCDPDDLRPGYASEVIECADELAALLTSEGPAPTDVNDGYAPFYLVALRQAREVIEKHDEWCGYKKDSPGNAIIWRAERSVGNAIRRLEGDTGFEAKTDTHSLPNDQPAQRPETPTVGTWQPIETAPKDGSRVLIYTPGFQPDTDGIATAVWGDDNYYVTFTLITPEPTHWMPLPDAPKEPTPA